jgi:hypothetical protein
MYGLVSDPPAEPLIAVHAIRRPAPDFRLNFKRRNLNWASNRFLTVNRERQLRAPQHGR